MSPAITIRLLLAKGLHARLSKPVARAVRMTVLSTLLLHLPAIAQQNEAEHLSHHPGAAASGDATSPAAAIPGPTLPSISDPKTNTPPAPNPVPDSPVAKPGMMEGMSKMMEGMMGGGARKEIYPFLMSLPALTAENRSEIERLAEERIHEGTLLLQTAQTRLSHAIQAGDHDAAAHALQQSRDGTAQVDSGVAAHRLIREGTAPQSVAVQWFTNSMGLAPANPNPHGLFGLTWFHYLTMFLLFAVAATMVSIYFYKAKRAAALLTRLGGTRVGDTPTAGDKPASPASAVAAPPMPAAGNTDNAPSKPNSWKGPLLVVRIFQETPQVKTYRLIDPAGGKLPFNFLPGQFLTFTVAPHGQAIKRSYTIASSPAHRDFCEVTVRHEDRGMVSGYLNDRVHEGELLQVTAPSGKFTFAGQDGNSIVLIAGGVGVTPMMSVIRYLTDRSWPGDIYLVYGCKGDDEVIFREEIEYLMRRYANLHVTLIAERVNSAKWPYPTGRITKELLCAAVPEIVLRHIHLCGPKPMMEAAKRMLAELDVPAEQIEIEVFIGKEIPQTPDVSVPPSHLDAAAAPTVTATATFARSNKTAALPPSKTILEAAEDVGVDIDYSCRVGTCGVCKVKLLSGAVTMEIDDALDPADKTQNVILACQAKATSDLSVDA